MKVIAADDNGTVDPSEYVLFNLKKMGKVNTSIRQTLAVNPNIPTLTLSLVPNPILTPSLNLAPTFILPPPSLPPCP